MLRAEHCICGTSTVGTGTLTLAACPAPPGGTDLYQAFQVQGLGTSVAIPVSYTIVEYTGSDFQIATRQEKGVGLLTLGASITATTLARTTVQQTATGMTGAATYDVTSPTAIAIATAANVLVFIGASSTDLVPSNPYYDVTLTGSDTLGGCPVNAGSSVTGNISIARNNDNYNLFEWRIPTLVRTVTVKLTSPYTNTSKIYGRLYAVGLNARPTKLLWDFGSGGLSVITGNYALSVGGTGFYLQPGEYFLDLMLASSSAGPATFAGFSQPYNTGRLGYGTAIGGAALQINASSASTLAGDPANVSGISMASSNQLFFAFK